MARSRTLKPEFWTDDVIVELSFAARLFYQGCWNFALCDQGHIDASPKSLKMKIFPADDVDPAELIEELVKHGRLIRKQTPDGRAYLHVGTLVKHTKMDTRWNTRCHYCALEGPPKLASTPRSTPEPSETPASSGEPSEAPPSKGRERKGKERKGKEGKVLGAVHASAHPPPPDNPADTAADLEQPVEPKPQPPPKPSGTKGTRIPDDFTVTADMVEWARKTCPAVDGRRETEKFANHWRAKSGRDATKINWELTWRNWMLRAAEYAPARASPPPQPRRSTTDDRVNAALNLADQIRREGQLELEKPP